MFYEKQPEERQFKYKELLTLIGSLSNLFSESDEPYLAYRAHENIFCESMKAENLARHDCSADAKFGSFGIGLKTWVGSDMQKVAEFNKLKNTFDGLNDEELVKKISDYRNERINITKRIYDIDQMLYHVVKRQKGTMLIYETAFDTIDIDKICLLPDKGRDNCVYFTDNKHVYNFNKSKSTLYMMFDDMELLDEIEVTISSRPYEMLKKLDINIDEKDLDYNANSVCLRLYSESSAKGKFVPEKSGLNQWNASGRKRDPNEVYIPYPAEDRFLSKGFFPNKDEKFNLHLPNGKILSAKLCQQDSKAIMSNPNKDLGKWLLRDVFGLDEGELLTYEMLEKFNIDSVIFRKISDKEYSIDFCELGTYDKYKYLKNSENV